MIQAPFIRSTTEPIYRPMPPRGGVDADALAEVSGRLAQAKAARDTARAAEDAIAYRGAAHAVSAIRAEIGALAPPLPYPRWYALIARPQKEAAARAWLDRHGVVSFYPVTDARKMRRGKPVHYERKYLPGYLFAQFPGEPVWHVLLASPFVHDVIRLHNGTPGILHPDTLQRLHAMRQMDQEIEVKRRYRKMIRVGDRAKVRSGPFEGFEVETVEVDAASGKGKFAIMLFGGPSNAEMSLDQVEKL